MAKELHTLGWDYFMFVLFILITVFGPLWKRIFGKKKERSKADYVFATGGISIVAIMLSIARGTLGVRTVLGYPSELFYRGSAMWEIIYGMVSAYPIVCFVFVPVYFNLGITSVYQYIDLRFKSRLVRCLASATYIVRQICNLGITVYTPSVALSTVIGIPYWASIVGMAVICIFFTIMGGLKAAINADVIQTATVIVVTLAVIVKGLMASGGAQHVYEVNRDHGRLKFFSVSGDMTVRVDTLSAWLGQLFMSLSQFGCQQNFMQRYVSLKSMSQVRRVMMTNIPIVFVFFSLSWISGMVIYATYVNCDPYAEGYIRKPDEILPFFVEDQLAVIPGFVGIFMAMLFNGALCMMVSNLNSLATVCWEDFISQLPQFKGLSDKQQLFILKVITVICGLIIMGVAFGVGLLSGVIESSLLAFSATSGPLLGCFMLAMLVPIANWKGTSAGMISSCAFVLWIITGSATVDKSGQNPFLPTSTEGCTNTTFSQSITKPNELGAAWLLSHSLVNDTAPLQQTIVAPERTPLETFYSVSYMYYSLLGAVITVGVGIIISYLTRDPKDAYDAKLLHPVILRWCESFPGDKPYIIGEATSDLTTVDKGKGANVNHGFDVQNDANAIIGTTNEKQKHNPIEVMFTNGQSDHKNDNTADRCIATGNLARAAELYTPPSGGENGTYRQFKEKESV
ncbi:sodium-coupled monocarboxylate transporter 1 [Anastrepha ludens]|uniref:sodium-coupled monocarboxylate transporter 1 n=1 Tax=Anastrepha ludens TaxID=28586 RepID=UPI0023AE7D92|nr:sodium-coupled monocarboxylate transporter 1 [Anastrepha ludens]XP_053947283.1 sodium-coupled monocarboxylate transporter 1 [Anastrepha ludens]XP_053947284.1 sodium-coupled monocarboxylate transporter 1 [Anastrepha ludens]XP_053947285.1 sodium-coupled monocarboxylate transporter 1 [Anastrepha ludens]XP_053947286.1 sodium-coupled monocarboxylate transporter 1 [Anastrepha ludens]XP_053947287.1 sodium-coupled monocarboxylate transporter 1 [Anastrepha ludens]